MPLNEALLLAGKLFLELVCLKQQSILLSSMSLDRLLVPLLGPWHLKDPRGAPPAQVASFSLLILVSAQFLPGTKLLFFSVAVLYFSSEFKI